ncbi:MAG TPA: ATP-binding protein [Planctomycetota bacterium]|nr:ATP-binding protein [Planctomycetota bacterium]
MQSVQEHITIPADRTRLAEIRSAVRALCKHHGVSPKTTRRIVLAIDEAVANVMEHSGASADSRIDVLVDLGPSVIVASIRDRGRRFDPTGLRKTLPDACRRTRGFGLHLIRLVTDHMEYQRTDDGTNVLTLRVESR